MHTGGTRVSGRRRCRRASRSRLAAVKTDRSACGLDSSSGAGSSAPGRAVTSLRFRHARQHHRSTAHCEAGSRRAQCRSPDRASRSVGVSGLESSSEVMAIDETRSSSPARRGIADRGRRWWSGGGGVPDAERMALVFAGLRIFVGIVWIANLSWKLPPDFGRHDARGLLFSFELAHRWALVEPLPATSLGGRCDPHFTLFGWLVFAIELAAGVLLTLGLMTRLGALLEHCRVGCDHAARGASTHRMVLGVRDVRGPQRPPTRGHRRRTLECRPRARGAREDLGDHPNAAGGRDRHQRDLHDPAEARAVRGRRRGRGQ